jgi:prepilin-type N-terminal cleavage/methylation domain-containing protein
MDCVRRDRRDARAGVTLVELMVVLVLLTVMAGVVGLAWRPAPAARARVGDARDVIAAARLRAIESGTSVMVVVTAGDRRIHVTAHPDGSLLGAASLGFDPLTGVPAAADTTDD